jgi:DNA-binding SARP family transcriptional activator
MGEGLDILLTGGLTILLDGAPVVGFVSAKVPGLVAYLSRAGRACRREALADLLWDDRPQGRALGNLRVVLTNVRRRLAPYIAIDRATVGLDPLRLRVDVTELERRIHTVKRRMGLDSPAETVRAIEAALVLYRGEFLEGFHVAHSRGFEAWALGEREQLQALVVEALQLAIRLREQLGDTLAATEHALHLLRIDPLEEESHRALMRLMARAGRRGAALAQYEACRRMLAEELEVEPIEETTALYHAIRAGDPELVAG